MNRNECKSNAANAVLVFVLIALLTFLLLTISYLFTYLGNENSYVLDNNYSIPQFSNYSISPAEWNPEANTTFEPTTNGFTYAEFFVPNSNWSSPNKFIFLFDHHVYVSPQSGESVSANWIEQRLNHFNVADERRWKQRYFVNDNFFELGGPAFLMVGGENQVDSRWIKEGQWMEWARKTHAICFILEHRYYGKSRPTNDTQLENLRYLNTAQALVDLANFRTLITEKYGLSDQSKWITLGSYYAGCLAMFARLKYPHLFDVAVATGPIFQKISDLHVPQNNFLNFSYSNIFNPNCSIAIDDGIIQLRQIFENTEDWHIILSEKLRLCTILETSDELRILIDYIENYFLSNTKITDEVLCNIMTEKINGREIDRIAIIISLMLDSLDQSCLAISFDEISDYLTDTNWSDMSSENGDRQWLYQKCNEFSGFGKENFYWKCAIIFGDDLIYDYRYTNLLDNNFFNMFYGNENFNITKSIIIIHPKHYWLQMQGFPTVNNEMVKVIRTQNISEFSEMNTSSSTDSTELVQTREAMYEQIIQWIS